MDQSRGNEWARIEIEKRDGSDGYGPAGREVWVISRWRGGPWGLDPDPTNLIVVFGAKTGATALSAPRPLAREITVVRNQRKLDNPLYHLFRSQSSDKAFAARVATVKIA
jgi:hypothetical protein